MKFIGIQFFFLAQILLGMETNSPESVPIDEFLESFDLTMIKREVEFNNTRDQKNLDRNDLKNTYKLSPIYIQENRYLKKQPYNYPENSAIIDGNDVIEKKTTTNNEFNLVWSSAYHGFICKNCGEIFESPLNSRTLTRAFKNAKSHSCPLEK